jgi:NAD(P)-dependent dehydrogenase (short-subunit alcohol dehydrogenase family)
MNRPETIEETAELVTTAGGTGIPVRVDHTVEEQVKQLFERVSDEQLGHLDVLVNDIWGGDSLTVWGRPFWEGPVADGILILQRSVHSHIITSRYGAPLMTARRTGLIIEITDGTGYDYRGNLIYSLAKISAIHLAAAMAADLRPYEVTALALTPGFLRSEAMLDYFGVQESNWKDAVLKDKHFIASETPAYVGGAVAALAADPNVFEKTGQSLSSWGLSEQYDFIDADGNRPHWGNYYDEHVAHTLGK